jgi:hypothetical protein
VSGRFRVAGAIALESVGLFALHGSIAEGVVRAGDLAVAESGFRAWVHGVEFVRLSAGSEDVALTFRAGSASELAQWQGLTWPEVEIVLTDGRAA